MRYGVGGVPFRVGSWKGTLFEKGSHAYHVFAKALWSLESWVALKVW